MRRRSIQCAKLDAARPRLWDTWTSARVFAARLIPSGFIDGSVRAALTVGTSDRNGEFPTPWCVNVARKELVVGSAAIQGSPTGVGNSRPPILFARREMVYANGREAGNSQRRPGTSNLLVFSLADRFHEESS